MGRVVVRWIVGLVLGLGLSAPGSILADAPAEPAAKVTTKKKRAASTAKRKKSKRKKRKRRARRRSKRKRRITAKTIKAWQRRGLTNRAIVRRAKRAGYVVTAAEKKRLKRRRVRRSLIAALPRPKPTSTEGTGRIDLDEMIEPHEIDFDSVPPPDGMPPEYAEPAPAKKSKLNTSLRPSALDDGTSRRRRRPVRRNE